MKKHTKRSFIKRKPDVEYGMKEISLYLFYSQSITLMKDSDGKIWFESEWISPKENGSAKLLKISTKTDSKLNLPVFDVKESEEIIYKKLITQCKRLVKKNQ